METCKNEGLLSNLLGTIIIHKKVLQVFPTECQRMLFLKKEMPMGWKWLSSCYAKG